MSLLLLLIYFNDLSCIGDTLWYDDDATLISGGSQRDQDRMGCPADGCQKCLKSKKVMTENHIFSCTLKIYDLLSQDTQCIKVVRVLGILNLGGPHILTEEQTLQRFF